MPELQPPVDWLTIPDEDFEAYATASLKAAAGCSICRYLRLLANGALRQKRIDHVTACHRALNLRRR